MKVLTLVTLLMVTSVASGRVVKLTYNTVSDTKGGFDCHISIVSDQPLPYYTKGSWEEDGMDKKEFLVRLECKKDNFLLANAVGIQENMKKLFSLKIVLQKLFDVESLNLWRNDSQSLHPTIFKMKLEETFIKHGYQLTFKDCTDNKENESLNYFYFFKPDASE
jgi:hypothetical protein